MQETNKRDLEPGIVLDLKDRLSYGGMLRLDLLLAAQQPLGNPPHHDEMLFIIQHQTSELWIKLALHELRAALAFIGQDKLSPCFKILARVKLIQEQLFNQWAVLETLTPSEYAQFRHLLGPSSGFQSKQYRMLEFILGNKNAAYAEVFRHDVQAYEEVIGTLNAPSIYDEFLRYLHRAGFAVPEHCVERDFSEPHTHEPLLADVFLTIYEHTDKHWDAYDMCEKLVDIEESFQLWRFRHMKTVERIIGHKRGTGGSSGVSFLQAALKLTFFPELIDVRTRIGAAPPSP